MKHTISQLGSVVLLVIATVIGIISTLNNEWATEYQARNEMQSNQHHFGLWKRCEDVNGASYCDRYDDYLLGSSIELVGARAGMLLSIVFLSISICMMSCAVDCTTLVDSHGRKKLRLVCGVLVTISGVFMVLVAIMMAVVIGKHYHSQMYYMERSRYRRDAKGIRLGDLSSQMGNKAMNIGPGVFLAATSGILTLVAGGMMLCQSCGKSEDEYDCHYAQSTESIVNNKRKEYI